MATAGIAILSAARKVHYDWQILEFLNWLRTGLPLIMYEILMTINPGEGASDLPCERGSLIF